MARVFLQIPEGLKHKALEIARGLEERGDEVIVSSEPCWGACDVRPQDARALGCDKIVHVGHTKFLDTDLKLTHVSTLPTAVGCASKPKVSTADSARLNLPVEYIEYRADADPLPALEKDSGKLEKYKSIGLLTSLQFVDALPVVKKFLEGRGYAVFVGEVKEGEKYLHPGQILGCDVRAASVVSKEVDAFLYVGSGKFHSLGAVLKTSKPVFGLDLEKNEIRAVDGTLFQKQKAVAIARAKDAKVFGILVSTKIGQNAVDAAHALKKKLESKGKIAYVISADEIKPEKLMGMKVDCWVNTACPRIAVENRAEFNHPILNPDELVEVLE